MCHSFNKILPKVAEEYATASLLYALEADLLLTLSKFIFVNSIVL